MKTSLVILAAGIGSRFGGGVKQIAPVGPNGEIIIDYSIHDALEAGFDKIVFIIRKDIEKDFKEIIGDRVSKLCEVEYVYQSVNDLPFTPECSINRRKPWGTTHALWSARNAVKEPFLVINADDYYGKSAYKTAHDFLVNNTEKDDKLSLGMVGFVLGNTLSDNGEVTRGICKADDNDILLNIVETYNIIKTENGVVSRNDGGEDTVLDINSLVSMNMWCFTPGIFSKAEIALDKFLRGLPADDVKSEHVLPTFVGSLVSSGEATVRVLSSEDRWVGVTYAEDKPVVIDHFRKLIANKVYPEELF